MVDKLGHQLFTIHTNKRTLVVGKLPVAAFLMSDNCICTSNGLNMRFPFCVGIFDPWNNVQAKSRIKSYSLSPYGAGAGDGAANGKLEFMFGVSETLWLVVGATRLLKLALFIGGDKCSFPISSLLDGNVIE